MKIFFCVLAIVLMVSLIIFPPAFTMGMMVLAALTATGAGFVIAVNLAI